MGATPPRKGRWPLDPQNCETLKFTTILGVEGASPGMHGRAATVGCDQPPRGVWGSAPRFYNKQGGQIEKL